ncbi:MAG: hypothetical protein LUI09_05760 [Prevotellaceae bacterium]|nr:hypothetical protein [Prevotellaceae bacterium]
MKQYEAVIETMRRLGGVATLGQLNLEVFKIEDCEWHTKTPFASIRRIVQLDGNIYKIKPGLYGLKAMRREIEERGYIVETAKNKDSRAMDSFNHSYYQGLLLEIGKMKGLSTFVPQQDKNKKFLDKRLGDLSTMKEMPQYSYKRLVDRSSTVDVIWFNERQMPHSFFEIEHTTDIQNSLLKFNDLQDFHVKMVIVADERRKEEFAGKMRYLAFADLLRERRVSFLNYDLLAQQYEWEVKRQTLPFVL